MKTKLLTLFILLLTQLNFSQNNVTVNQTDFNNAYINVFNLSDEVFQFGFGYPLEPARASFPTSTTISLAPNIQIWDDNDETPCSEPFCSVWNTVWFDSPENANKIIEVSVFAQPTNGTLDGQDLNFSGTLSSFSLAPGYTVEAYIQVIQPVDPFFSLLLVKEPITSSTGDFTVSVPAASLGTGNIIQYGFVMRGITADPANIGNLGSVEIDENTLSSNDVQLREFKIYPNPSNDYWYLNSKTIIENIDIYNYLGSRMFSLSPKDKDIAIDIRNLNTGIYIAKLTYGNSTKTLKLIKN